MLKNITRILPFLIITILSIGGVELFYGVIERFILVPQAVTQENARTVHKKMTAAESFEQHTNFQVIIDRNLFRSYLKGDTAESSAAEEEKKNALEGLEVTSLELILMGTIAGPAEQSRAVIMEKRNKKQDIYYVGDVIQQAQIKEILRGKIILSFNGKDEILDMSEASSAKPPGEVTKKRVIPRRSVSKPRTRRVIRRAPQAVKPRQTPLPSMESETLGGDQDSEAIDPAQEDPDSGAVDPGQDVQDSDEVDPAQEDINEENVDEEPVPESDDDPDREVDRDGREI